MEFDLSALYVVDAVACVGLTFLGLSVHDKRLQKILFVLAGLLGIAWLMFFAALFVFRPIL